MIINSLLVKVESGGDTPSTSSQSIFTGATIPLTYKDNTHTSENTYVYASATHNITLAGLSASHTITGNGTKEVTVSFDVTSATSSLDNFTITCVKDTQTLVYNGMHAHYGTTVTGILTFAFVNVTKDGSEGTIGTNYKFIESDDDDLPLFATTTTLWNTIYSYQVINVLIGNYSSTTIGDYFLYECSSFNQPLDVSGITTIGTYFLFGCSSFNQPLDVSGVTTIGDSFLRSCLSFNQLLDVSGATTIGTYFLFGCSPFNQPLDVSGVTTIGDFFLRSCSSFNQPLTISSGVTTIGDYFLNYCSSFNQPLDVSGVTTIGIYFLKTCRAFNQPLTIPSGLTSIGTDFVDDCYSISTIIWNSTTYPTDDDSISQDINAKTDATNGAGIVVYGTQRAGLITALPNRTSTPFRKLINGGS